MALRYWVQVAGSGTGTWDATTTTHWSTTTGGAGGASVPTSTDDVIFDGNSGGGTVSLSGTPVAKNFSTVGFAGTINLGAAPAISGTAVTLSSATTFTGGAGMTLNGGGTVTFTSGGASFSALSSASNTVLSLADALSVTGTLTIGSGSFITNGFSVTCGSFSSSNSNTRTLTLGSSSVTCTASGTSWNVGTATGLTITANTATVTLSGASVTFQGATSLNLNGMSVVLTGSGAGTVNGSAMTLANLTRTGTASKTDSLALGNSFAVTGTLTLVSNSATNRLLVQSSTVGTQRGITCTGATVVIDNTAAASGSSVDFQDVAINGSPTWTVNNATLLGDCGGNSGITFTAPATQTHSASAGGNWSDVTKWTSRVPLPQDNVVVDVNTTGTLTADMPRLGASIDFTGFAATFVMSITGSIGTIFGNLTCASGMTWTMQNTLILQGRGNFTITTHGIGLPSTVIGAGTYVPQDALAGGDSARTFAMQTTGAFNNSNNVSVTFATITAASTSSFTAGTATYTTLSTSTATVFNFSSAATVSAASATFVISGASTNTRTFAGGGKTYGTLTYTVGNSPGALAITSANTFANLNVGPGRQLVMPASTTNAFSTAPSWSGAPNGYLYLPGVAGNYASTPDSAALSITGDIDIRVKVAMDNWANAMTFVTKTDSTSTASYQFETQGSGQLRFLYSTNGTAWTQILTSSANAAGLVNGTAIWLRVTRVVSTGSVTFYQSPDGITWTQVGGAVASTAGNNLFDSASSVEVGATLAGTSGLNAAKWYRAQILSGVGGTTQFDADFTTKTVGANTFAESSSNAATVTINGTLAQAGDGRVAVTSSTPGTQAMIRYTGPGTATSDYLTLQDILAVSLPTGSGIAVDGPADSGTETETTAIVSAVVSSDSATETEVASVSAAASGVDTGTGSESSSLAVGATDSATENEVQTIAASVTAVDSGVESDLVSISLSAVDTSTETETSLVAATPSSIDAGVGTSTASIVADVRAVDTGIGSEFVQLAMTALDNASETESTLVTALVAALDAGSAVESVLIGPFVTDMGVFIEAVGIEVIVSDGGTETEVVLILVQVVGLDVAAETEMSGIAAVVSSSDGGVGSEDALIGVAGLDQAFLSELAPTIFAALNAEDFGVEADVVLILGQMFSADAGTWHEVTDIAVDLHEHRSFIDSAEPARMNDGRSLVALAPAKMRRL